ncbi:tetratricopeptide repeat protein [Kitasatospora sp. NPDC058243]|uniref:tetratricopeptide repeat protein n=1 Tax=Kitasatospora sp. NPDC058243 TaxID=3346397 RepID=UPI0036D982C0
MLNVLGWVLTEEGRTPEALVHLEAASALAARAGDAFAEANALIVLAMVQASLGRLDQAARSCERAVELARETGDQRMERLAMQHLARHQTDAGHWHQALSTATHALALGNQPDTTDIPRVLLLTIRGEALLGLGNHTEGITQLDLAAREAESAGYDDGAVRALTALLRATPDTEVQARYDTALARLTTRT